MRGQRLPGREPRGLELTRAAADVLFDDACGSRRSTLRALADLERWSADPEQAQLRTEAQ